MRSNAATDGKIPTLLTERLRLRGHRVDDLDACAAMWADPAVTRHIGGRPSSYAQSWTRLLSYAGLWAHFGFGYWAIEDRATQRFIGELGFADFKRPLGPSLAGIPEIGWALASHAQRRGFATEAVRAAVTWADVTLTVACTICLIDPANVASIRVAEKCAYRELERVVFQEQPTIIFSRSA